MFYYIILIVKKKKKSPTNVIVLPIVIDVLRVFSNKTRKMDIRIQLYC